MNRRSVFLFLSVLLLVLSLCGCGLVEITAPTEPIRQQATPTQTPTHPATEAPTQTPTEPSEEVSTQPPTQPPTEASAPTETTAEIMDIPADAKPVRYVLNTNTYKFHEPDCKSVKDIREENKSFHTGTRDEAIEMGFEPCKNCNP